MRAKWSIVGMLAISAMVVVGCGDSSTPKQTSATTVAGSATTARPSGPTSATADLCTIITPAVVVDVMKVASVTRPSGAAGCQYNGPSGLLVSLVQGKLTKGDQATFDAYVKTQESGTTTKVVGVGDGDGAAAAHDINVTVYGFKGTNVVSATVFQGAADPATSGKTLVQKALAGL